MFYRLLQITTITFLFVSMLTLGLFNPSVSAQSRSQLFNNPEAFLSLSFRDDTGYAQVLRTLPRSSTYGITSLSTQITIDGKPFMVSVSGDYTISNINSAYRQQLSTFLTKLESIKSTGTDNLRQEGDGQALDAKDKQKLDRVLSGVSAGGIQRSKFRSLFSSGQILSLNLVGNTDALRSIQNSLQAYSKATELVTRQDIEQKQKEIQAQIHVLEQQGQSKEQAAQTIIAQQSEAVSPTQTNLVELNQEIIDKVDSVIKTDPSGNKFVSDSDLSTLNLSPEQKRTVQTLITSYNKTPEVVKNDVAPIIEEVKNDNLSNKITSATSNLFVNRKVHAWCSGIRFEGWRWYGAQFYVPDCVIASMIWGGAVFGVAMTVLAFGFTALGTLIATYLGFTVASLDFASRICGGIGASLHMTWAVGTMWAWRRC